MSPLFSVPLDLGSLVLAPGPESPQGDLRPVQLAGITLPEHAFVRLRRRVDTSDNGLSSYGWEPAPDIYVKGIGEVYGGDIGPGSHVWLNPAIVPWAGTCRVVMDVFA